MIVCLDLYEVALTQWEFPIGTCALVVLSIQIFVPIGIRQYRTRLPTVRRFALPGNSPGYQSTAEYPKGATENERLR